MTRRFGLALVAGLLSCAGPEAPQAPAPAARQEPIVNGSVNQSTAYETIGMLSNFQPGSNTGTACTATLIAPNVVLTAAHCAYGEPTTPGTTGPYVDVGNGWDAYFIMDWDANNPPYDNLVHVRKYYPSPSYDPANITNDVAIAVLDRDVTGDGPDFQKVWPIATSHIPDFDRGHGAHTLLFVGYGITSFGGNDSGTRRSVNIPQQDYNDQSSACWSAQYSDATQLCFSDYNSYGAGAHDICQGDSGGPALASIGGVTTVVGVSSFGPGGDCLQWGVDSRVDAFAQWIQQQVSSKAGLAENCGNGIDDDGDGKPDCQDPDCEGSPRCPNGIITPAGNCQACNATTPCQSGLTCVKSSASASNGICQANCSGTCSGTASCGTFLDDSQACTCAGQQLVADGANCYYNHYCHLGSKCVQGLCQPRCDNGFSCASGLLCNALTHVCEPPATTASSSSGTTGAAATTTSGSGSGTATSTGGATTAAAASTAAAGSTGGTPGSTAAAGSTAAGSTAGGTTGEPTSGAAGTTTGGAAGGNSGGFGGNAGAGAGAGASTGTTGQAPAKTGLFGCSSGTGAGLLPLLALAGLLRRRRGAGADAAAEG